MENEKNEKSAVQKHNILLSTASTLTGALIASLVFCICLKTIDNGSKPAGGPTQQMPGGPAGGGGD